jgi:7-carboxy-7-deazaguanine synthase
VIHATEVFSAIQGEGALVGERQVFARLAGCNIRCAYCDQPEALEMHPGPCRIERTAGRRDWEIVDSPLPVAGLAEMIRRVADRVPHHSVSLTGGEPLLQGGRTVDLARDLHQSGLRVMLETNGTLVPVLRRLLPWTDLVSMDVKLPSVDGETVAPSTQEQFLRTAVDGGLRTWVKVVVGADTDAAELDAAVSMVRRVAGGSPGEGDHPLEVFLQPVTPFAAVTRAPSADEVLELQERALRRYPRIRVVPQTHKAIGQL